MSKLRQFQSLLNEGISHEDLADSLINRLQMRYPDIIDKYGYDAVESAVSDVASFHAGAEELGTSDIGSMLKQIIKQLDSSSQGVEEGIFDRFKKKPQEPDDPRMMPAFNAAGGYKRDLDVMAWQMGWKLSKKHPGASADDAFQKLYYGGGSPFAFDEKTFKMAWNAAQEQSVREDSDPCWDNYKQIGMKTKNGKKVPNCVPKEGVEEGSAQVYKVLAVNKSNGLGKQQKLNVKASSIEEVLERLAASDWYPLEINGVEVINGKRLKQGVAEAGVAKHADLGATNDTTHFIKNITTGKIVSPHRGVQDARDALVGYQRNNKAGHVFKIVRAKKSVDEAYTQSPEELKRIAQGWAAKHPDIDAEIAAAEKNVDPYYNYASGAAWSRGKQAADHLEYLKSVKRIIDRGLGLAEDWQKVNKSDRTDGMSSKAVKAYRRENPGSKLQTAVTKKPSELKAGSKDAKRRKSFCARMSGVKGPMKDEKGRPTAKAKALSRWNCNEDVSIEEGLGTPYPSTYEQENKPFQHKNTQRRTPSIAFEDQLDELSNKKLGQYKKAAGEDARKADKEGDFKRGDKRFSGIVKATKKEFDNDAKQQVKESSILKGIKNVK